MNALLEEICNALDALAPPILALTADDRPFVEMTNWQFPPMTRHQLANVATNLANQIRLADIADLDPEIALQLKGEPARISLLRAQTVPQMLAQYQAIHTYMMTLENLRATLMPQIIWTHSKHANLMPTRVARRLNVATAKLDAIEGEFDALHTKIDVINDAHSAAESLPSDLLALQEARDHLRNITTDSAKDIGKIEENRVKSNVHITHMEEANTKAKAIIAAADEAYRAATTQGLGAAFDARANALKTSLMGWVAALIGALVAAWWIGAGRVDRLMEILNSSTQNWNMIWLQLLVTALSIGAPLWFAWLSTKQIGQHFKLSEDYAFKASVAKAYEGYRTEAARIDIALEARLFASALTRLEEAPLRFIDAETHGSPWHELVSHSAFRKALDTVPELKNAFVDIAKRGADSLNAPKGAKPVAPVIDPG